MRAGNVVILVEIYNTFQTYINTFHPKGRFFSRNFEHNYRLLKVDFRTSETQFSKNGIIWIIERR